MSRNQTILLVLAAVLLVAALAVVVFLVLSGGESEPADESWTKIEAAGKMVVGTSADHPPFEYYNDQYQLDGFDMALIRELGQRLGVQVEIQDMAFEGLQGALQLGQIDVAIAGITYTPERDAEVDFSYVYFVSEDAVLARRDAVLNLQEPAGMAPYRVGVQRGSVFEDWLRSDLVGTGLMRPENLLVYQQADHAVTDLERGAIDLVVMDVQPARKAEQEGNFVVAAQGFRPQPFAIAIPQGAAALQAKLNETLLQMQNEGRFVALAQHYLNLQPDEIIPVPTPDPGQPTATPPLVASGQCVDGMASVADLTYDDQNVTVWLTVDPGNPFQKGWRIRNTGTCPWDNSYRLMYVGGNVPAARMGGRPTPIVGTVAQDQEYDMYVDLVAPLTPGVYQGFWQMVNGSGMPFGARIWVAIRSHSTPPAPGPTSTPSPFITFTADRTQLKQGECTLLRWTTENVQAVHVYRQGEPWDKYPVTGEGNREVCPAYASTYEIRVQKQDNSVEIRQVRIDVEQTVGAPIIQRFTADPPYEIYEGQCLNLQWDVVGTVTNVRLLRNGEMLQDPSPISGSRQDCPPAVGEQVYRIEASGPGGTSILQRVIQVIRPTAEPPTPTPPVAEPPPEIRAFSVTPNQVEVGQCVSVAWNAGGSTSWVKILRDADVVLDGAPLSGQAEDCLDSVGLKTYRVEARNAAGQTESREQIVNVTEAAVQNPLANTNWQLTSLTGGQVPLPETTITAFFRAGGGLSGNGGCNSYNGTYTVDGATLSVGALSVTGVTCGADIDQQEQSYVAALQSAASFEIEANQLVIRDAGGNEVLRFSRIV